MYKSSLLPGNIYEGEYRCKRFHQLLPADAEEGRQHDLIQFMADPGGLRTVRVKDVVNIR